MPMQHKAFSFDNDLFTDDLSPVLYSALDTGSVTELIRYIESNLAQLRDPYEGQALDAHWQELLQTRDPHQFGDFALTKFYSPTEDVGVGVDWEVVDINVRKATNGRSTLLGRSFGPVGKLFDPGKYGSYFQSHNDVADALALLRTAALSGNRSELKAALRMFDHAAQDKKGLYVTF